MPACGQTTLAALPDEVVGQFGPQLTALILYLTVVCRLPGLVVRRLLWRQIMLRARSDRGERAVGRLLTIARTYQLQHLDTLVYLTAAITPIVGVR